MRRRNFAAFALRNGAPVRAFKAPPLSGSVLELVGTRLFVNSARSGRRHVTQLEVRTGARARSFRVAGAACALAATRDTLVVGGGFRSLVGRPFENLGFLDLR